MTTSLARPPKVLESVGLTIPFGKSEADAWAAEAQATALALRGSTVESEDELVEADAMLTAVVRKKDAVVAERTKVTSLTRAVEAMVRPAVKAWTEAEDTLKGAIGAYRLAKLEASKELAAEVSAELTETNALSLEGLQKITESQALVSRDAGESTTRYAWKVKRLVPELLPDEWWTPDEVKIAAHARAFPGDGDAPVIPGVVFERTPIVGARR